MYTLELLGILSVLVLLLFCLRPKGRFRGLLACLSAMILLIAIVYPSGWRWQMFPAVLAYGIATVGLYLGLRWLRWSLAFIAMVPLTASVFLTTQFPVLNLPAPSGEYGVGTFSRIVFDESRAERYAPTSPRMLGIQVWYPAIPSDQRSYRTLFQELYTGPLDTIAFFTSYLAGVSTHSMVGADVVSSEKTLPVILFNHGLFGIGDQNILLMEHLASNGYVVVSIVHPYEAMKVSTPEGAILLSTSFPPDVGFTSESVSDGGIGSKLGTIVGKAHSDLTAALYRRLDQFLVVPETERLALVRQAVESEELSALGEVLTETGLFNFFLVRAKVRNRSIESWVQDIQFVADDIQSIASSVPNLSERLDTSQFGVVGMSYGGAAAGEFCKIDPRCAAGSNIDGTQFGTNWRKPVKAPFLMMYSDANPGGNDYGYYPPEFNFYELHVRATEHVDYVDALYAFPVFKTLGLSGDIDRDRMIGVINDAQLAFFDSHLKSLGEQPDRVFAGFGDDIQFKKVAGAN